MTETDRPIPEPDDLAGHIRGRSDAETDEIDDVQGHRRVARGADAERDEIELPEAPQGYRKP
jgi:hypothetical protein